MAGRGFQAAGGGASPIRSTFRASPPSPPRRLRLDRAQNECRASRPAYHPSPQQPAAVSAVLAFVRRAWKRRWVKVLAVLAALPFIFYFLLWLLFARGLPDAEFAAQLPAAAADQRPRHQRRAGADLRPRAAGRSSRYRRIPAAADRRLPLGRGQDLLHPYGIDYPGLLGAVCDYVAQGRHRRARPRRLDHHPAGRQESSSSATNIR